MEITIVLAENSIGCVLRASFNIMHRIRINQRCFENTLQALLILLAIQLSFLFASATGVCAADNSDIREDTLKISEKLSHVYGFSPIYPKTNSVTEDMIHLIDTKAIIYDEQELKVDRSLP